LAIMLPMPKTKLSRPLQNLLERRGKKTLPSMSRYLALSRVAHSNGCPHKVDGPSPGGASAELGISRQAVHRAIDRGTLDAWYVKMVGEGGSAEFYVFVTGESIRRYKASGRRRA
jgi:hypothetical protein